MAAVRRVLAWCLATLWLWPVVTLRADEPPPPAPPPAGREKARGAGSVEQAEGAQGSKFIRLLRSDDGTVVALQTAIVAYGRPDEAEAQSDGQADEPQRSRVEVHLIGAVHIGEAEYYEALNKAFQQYDAVLYELVAPEGTRIERGDTRRDRSVVSRLQVGMKQMLELEFQLEHVDYQKPHLLHADLYGIPAARLASVPVVITSRHNDNTFRRQPVLLNSVYAGVINLRERVVYDAGCAIEHALCSEEESRAPRNLLPDQAEGRNWRAELLALLGVLCRMV